MTDFTLHKNKLETQLITITKELQTIGILDVAADNWEAVPDQEGVVTAADADDNTNADVVEEWNERRANLTDLEREYRDIKRALAKIENETYGTCEIGGEVIEPERLAYKPDARTCTIHMNEEATLPL